MNLLRHNPELEHLRDGTAEGDLQYFFKQWNQVSEGRERDYRHHSSVSVHLQSPKIFTTPYAEKYFEGVLPDTLPENSKVDRVMVVTDLDVKFWYSEHINPRQGFPTYPDVYRDVVQELYDPEDATKTTKDCDELSDFIFSSLLFNMRHMPKAVFHHTDSSTALVVLSAANGADFYLKEMAGIGCLPEMGFDTGEIHDAMMRHEWFHLSDDRHLSDAQMEIEADRSALKDLTTSSLKEAWVNARVVGGFMWPFPGRQNGIALIDGELSKKFSKKANQEMQMNVVLKWCDHVFKEFYDREIAIDLVFQVMEDHYDHISKIDKEVREFFNNKVLSIRWNGVPYLPSSDNFEEWFKEGDNPKLADRAWKYLTQANMMKLQVSNAHNIEFYQAMHALSQKISPDSKDDQTIQATVHHHFRNSLKALLPNVDEGSVAYQPAWRNVQLPGVKYPYTPYIGEQHEGALNNQSGAQSFAIYTV